MPLPAGFKVNGAKSGTSLVPPRVKKIAALLDKQPFGELMTSNEISYILSLSVGGAWSCHPALIEYREKVDNKYFWGSRKSIAQLRKQLAKLEETNENQ
jgi:hypothetical protein